MHSSSGTRIGIVRNIDDVHGVDCESLDVGFVVPKLCYQTVSTSYNLHHLQCSDDSRWFYAIGHVCFRDNTKYHFYLLSSFHEATYFKLEKLLQGMDLYIILY